MASTQKQNQGITLIGIGNMGLALALALLKANNSVTIWNRTTTRPQVKTAIEAGAVLEGDIAAAISRNDTIIICLLDYDTINQAFAALPKNENPLGGKLLINLTNGTMRQATEMQTWALEKAHARQYFDGAVMVTPQMVGGPHSFLVVSGGDTTSNDMEATQGILAPIGRVQYLGTDITAGARFDLAALSSMYGMFAGSFIGMGLLKRAPAGSQEEQEKGHGKKPAIGKTIKEAIVPFLKELVPYLGLIADTWDEERWDDNLGNPVGMQLQGMRNIVDACRDEGVDGDMFNGFRELLKKVVELHGTDAGLAGVGELLLKRE